MAAACCPTVPPRRAAAAGRTAPAPHGVERGGAGALPRAGPRGRRGHGEALRAARPMDRIRAGRRPAPGPAGGAASSRRWCWPPASGACRCTAIRRRPTIRSAPRHAGVLRAPPRPVRQSDAASSASARADEEDGPARCCRSKRPAWMRSARAVAVRRLPRLRRRLPPRQPPDAIREHHQGGITGYQARELVASASTATGSRPAWRSHSTRALPASRSRTPSCSARRRTGKPDAGPGLAGVTVMAASGRCGWRPHDE
jgi:hypothetical protein